MSLEELIRANPIVVSVQAAPDSPLAEAPTLLKLARASLANGAAVLRLQGVESIGSIRRATGAPVIGLIKRDYDGSRVYITPTLREVDELIETGCEAIALDATLRPRPCGATFGQLAERIRTAGRLVFADCDNESAVRQANEAHADLVSTTLAGYTDESTRQSGPDLEFLRKAVEISRAPVLAEGRFVERAQVRAALRIGAIGVVMGGAVNDPVKQTRMFADVARRPAGLVGAVDVGGTWLRFGTFSADGELLEVQRTPVPEGSKDRLSWIAERVAESGVCVVGVGTGGTVDPTTGQVVESKETIGDNVGTVFSSDGLGVRTIALNDGLATAWGHGCNPMFAGKRVATLALGTGVGCGLVVGQKLLAGWSGGYPRLNDLRMPGGGTVEEALGGAVLSSGGSMDRALEAARFAVEAVRALWMPDEIVVCGGVGLAMKGVDGVMPSPYGEDAGLYGAAALALYPPDFA